MFVIFSEFLVLDKPSGKDAPYEKLVVLLFILSFLGFVVVATAQDAYVTPYGPTDSGGEVEGSEGCWRSRSLLTSK